MYLCMQSSIRFRNKIFCNYYDDSFINVLHVRACVKVVRNDTDFRRVIFFGTKTLSYVFITRIYILYAYRVQPIILTHTYIMKTFKGRFNVLSISGPTRTTIQPKIR